MKNIQITVARPIKRLALILLLVAGGCSKNTIVFDNGGNGGALRPGTTAQVSFNASVESRMLTRSMSPIKSNVRANLYVYSQSESGAPDALVTQGMYQSSAVGQLTGLEGYKMQLADGTYTIFGVSTNSSTVPPTFDNKLSAPLRNGVDYLWWGGTNQEIHTVQVNIPIVFLHSATQIVFEVVPGDGIQIDELVSLKTFSPIQGAQMDLTTGVIPPAIKWGQGFDNTMGISGMFAQSIFLPMQPAGTLPAVIEARINGESSSRGYSVEVPVPAEGLQAGHSYRFKLVINANSATFPAVNVTDWVDVDETGKPVYPTQIYPTKTDL